MNSAQFKKCIALSLLLLGNAFTDYSHAEIVTESEEKSSEYKKCPPIWMDITESVGAAISHPTDPENRVFFIDENGAIHNCLNYRVETEKLRQAEKALRLTFYVLNQNKEPGKLVQGMCSFSMINAGGIKAFSLKLPSNEVDLNSKSCVETFRVSFDHFKKINRISK